MDATVLAKELRNALGQFATGVTVISTCSATGSLVGVTANSFAALSLAPPLVTWALRLNSASLPAFDANPRFVVTILAQDQVELSRKFAKHDEHKFENVAYAFNEHGLPMLHGAAAWFECKVVARHEHGDHCLYVAEVERFAQAESEPLVFHSGAYHALGSIL